MAIVTSTSTVTRMTIMIGTVTVRMKTMRIVTMTTMMTTMTMMERMESIMVVDDMKMKVKTVASEESTIVPEHTMEGGMMVVAISGIGKTQIIVGTSKTVVFLSSTKMFISAVERRWISQCF
jgi:hypothetical protein